VDRGSLSPQALRLTSRDLDSDRDNSSVARKLLRFGITSVRCNNRRSFCYNPPRTNALS